MARSGKMRLMFFASNTAKTKSFSFSRFSVISASVLLLFVLSGLIYGTSVLVANNLTARAMSRTLEENRDLKQALVRIEERLTEVDLQLGTLAVSDDRLRLQADIPRIDKDTREVGIGGHVGLEVEYVEDDQTVRKLIYDLDKIEREIRLQRSSFLEINRQLNEKQGLLNHTPSIRPLQGGYISSGFGRRPDPFTRRPKHHNGTDYSVERGTPVFATADGKVVFAKRTSGLGNLIILDHDFGFRTAYGHLSVINTGHGQRVTRGQKIGEVGNTGRSTAPHLHYEVHVMGKAVDPLDYIFRANAASLALR